MTEVEFNSDPELEDLDSSIDPTMTKVPTTTKLLKLKTEERQVYYNKYRALGQFYCCEVTPLRGKPSYCKVCNSSLLKGEVRLRHIVCTSKCGLEVKDKHKPNMDACGRYHIRCFLNLQMEKLEMFTSTNPEFVQVRSTRQLAGFDELTTAQQQFVIDTLPTRKRSLGADRLKALQDMKDSSSPSKKFRKSQSPSPKKSPKK